MEDKHRVATASRSWEQWPGSVLLLHRSSVVESADCVPRYSCWSSDTTVIGARAEVPASMGVRRSLEVWCGGGPCRSQARLVPSAKDTHAD